MEFRLDKSAKASFKWGKKVSAEEIPLNDKQVIQDLDQAETYKYLGGMEDGEGVKHHKMKVKIRKEYKRRIKLVLKSELNARNKIAAINTLAVPQSSTAMESLIGNWMRYGTLIEWPGSNCVWTRC